MAQATNLPLRLAGKHYIDYTWDGKSFDSFIVELCNQCGINVSLPLAGMRNGASVTPPPLTFAPPVAASPVIPPAKPDLFEQKIEAAWTFTGKRNKDWKPLVTIFPQLKIPDMWFCLVPVGEFQMGSNEYYDDEKPQHLQKIIAPYWIAHYPVTNAQWALAVRAGVVKEPLEMGDSLKWYKNKAMADAPVVGVTWFMARDFAEWCGARLPTEREWEYAARGVEGVHYTWGNDWDAKIPVWYENSGGRPIIVSNKVKGMSWIGAHHLIGNVWEWTGSLYEEYPYPIDGSREQNTGDRIDVRRVLRGGSWVNNDTDLFRAARRNANSPDYSDYGGGFRLALSI